MDGDIEALLFNPVFLTIPKWHTKTSEVDSKLSPINVGP
jgi:hypothetical protein